MDVNSTSSPSEGDRVEKERTVMAHTYKEILQKCFPIEISCIQFIGGGSYRVFEINNTLIFRFTHGGPVELLKREKEVCEFLRDSLSLPIPDYLWFSDKCPSFCGAVGGYKKLEGEPLWDIPFQVRQDKTAHQIGHFLSELHAIKDDTTFSHKKAHEELTEFFNQIQKKAFPFLNKKEQKWTQSLFDTFLDEPWNFAPVFTHGDFDSSNILYSLDKGVCGIIDFEEAHMGDPAWDFCSLLAEYGAAFLRNVLTAYEGCKDQSLLKRIQFHAGRIIFCELLYGIEYDQPEFTAHGLTRLRRAISNCDIIGGWLNQSTSLTRI